MWNSNVFNKLISRILLVFCVFMMLLTGYYQVKDYYQINHYEIIEAGEAIQQYTSREALVIAPYNGDTAFLYHTKRFGYPVVDESIEKMIERGADYYVSVNFDNDTNYVMKRWEIVEKNDKYVIVNLTKETNY